MDHMDIFCLICLRLLRWYMLGPWLHVYPAAAITCADNITSDLSLPSHRARHVTASHSVVVLLGFLNFVVVIFRVPLL